MASLSLSVAKISPYSGLLRRDSVRFSSPFTVTLNRISAPKSVSRAMLSPRKALSSSNLSGFATSLLDFLRASPATWESSIASNLLIFTLGLPLLLSGLSASGIGSAFLLGVLTWRAFNAPGFFLVAIYFVAIGKYSKWKDTEENEV